MGERLGSVRGMRELPELDPALLERLALAPDAFEAVANAFIESVPSRPADEAFLERALGYPWARPDGSYLLDGDVVTPASELSPDARATLRDGRVPLLAIGSNGSPSALIRKFAHLPADERRILVETGTVAGLDIGAVASPTVYGSFPATPIESPGTQVSAALLRPSPVQLEALTWSELNYWVGWLQGHPFTPDDGDARCDGYLLYVARWGALTLGGQTVALAAVPARDRTARPLTQQQMLDATAQLWRGPGATAHELLHALATDHAATRHELTPLLRPHAQPFAPPGWTRLPAAAEAAQ